jgi:hypothetical protein
MFGDPVGGRAEDPAGVCGRVCVGYQVGLRCGSVVSVVIGWDGAVGVAVFGGVLGDGQLGEELFQRLAVGRSASSLGAGV